MHKNRQQPVTLTAAVLVGLTFTFVASCFAQQSPPAIVDDPIYTQPVRMVEVEKGRRINIYCIGSGSPTVVFDSGLTSETSSWGFVQPTVALKTRACSYDRAGVGFSDPSERPGSSENIADDLHHLLVNAQIKPPYILVGHSYGGMNIKLYAARFPVEVAGMVFVDPSHENQRDGYRILDPRQLSSDEWQRQTVEPGLTKRRECVVASISGLTEGTALYKKCSFPRDPTLSDAINDVYQRIYMQTGFQKTQLSEEESIFSASADQLRTHRRSFADIPITVLTRSPSFTPLSPKETRALRDARYQMWLGLHEDIASLSTQSVHRVVINAGHNIPFDQPKAVSDAILEMWTGITSGVRAERQ